MKTISLGKHGKFKAIVDDDDFDELSRFKWCKSTSKTKSSGKTYIYAVRNVWVDGKNKTIRMTHAIMNPPKGKIIDHKNGDTLDNRKSNLRVCSIRENTRNSSSTLRRVNKHIVFKGVYQTRPRYHASIRTAKRCIYLGEHKTQEDAARAYDRAAIKYFGEFARLNFPRKDYPDAAGGHKMGEDLGR